MEYVINKAARRPSLKGLGNESPWRPAKVLSILVMVALINSVCYSKNEEVPMEYVINKAAQRPSLKGLWDETPWRSANVIALTNFLAQSKSRHPRVEAKAVYQDDGLFVFFRVFDKYVRCVQTQYQGSVCTDSCVEFFVEPRAGRGYFNFEINCGGTLLLYYCVPQPAAAAGEAGPKAGKPKRPVFNPVPWELGRQVAIYHSLPQVVDPEIEQDTEWKIEYFIPFAIFEQYFGPLGPMAGQVWRANFYKCADKTSQPHWLTWAPMGAECDFHLPQYFAPIRFSP